MEFTEINPEVLYTRESITRLDNSDVKFLKERALLNSRKRIRLCFHKSVEDSLLEMLIVHTKGVYVRPHKHINKVESAHIIEGHADLVIFDDEGGITEVIPVGDYASGKRFYYKVLSPVYHMLLIYSDFFIFHEVINGPFRKEDATFAPWSPRDEELQTRKDFLLNIEQKVKELTKGK